METQNTVFLLPQSVVGNGVTTGNQFTNPNNILLADGELTNSQPGAGESSDIIVGNFNVNLPQNAVVLGVKLKLKAERGAQTVPDITVQPVLVNETDSGLEFYPGSIYTGLTTDLADHLFGSDSDLWGKSEWTVDEINNIKVQLISSGSVGVDTVLPQVYYYIAEDPNPPTPIEGACENCNSTIQALPFLLARTWEANDTVFYLRSFNLPDGTPITMDLLGGCGGEITLVFDKEKPKLPGQNFIENVVLRTGESTIETLSNGLVKIDIGTLDNRGIGFSTPYGASEERRSEHAINSEVLISNTGRYQDRFLQKCHVGVLVSNIIKTQDEGNQVVGVTETYNFIGDNVQAEQDAIDAKKANVTFITNPSNVTPEVEDETTGTTGSTPATSLTIEHTIVDANYLRVWVSTENETISSVTYDGVSMTLIGQEINAPEGLKVALYGLVNPAVGANDIVVTMGTAVNITAGGVSFLNVDTSNPTDGVSSGAIGTSAAPSDSITTTVNNTVVQDVVGTTNNPTLFTQSGLWTVRGEINAASRPGASSTRKLLVPGLATDTYAISGSYPWAIILAGVRGAVLPSAAYVESVTGTYMDDSDPQNVVSVVPLNNTAAVAPTVTDDSSYGYAVDSKWFDSVTGTLYTCEDATIGAAVWTAIVSATPGTLDIQENGVSVENPVNTIDFITNGGIVTTPSAGKVAIDLTALGVGVGGGGTLIDSDTTTQSIAQNTVGTTETTIYTIPVPAGTLGTKNAIRTNVMFDDSLNLNNGAQATIRVKYGGTTIGSILLESSGATVTAGFSMKLENIILAAGSASSQKNYTKLSLSQDNIIFQSTTPQISHNGDGSEYTTSSVDSSNNQDIEVTIQYNSTPNSLIVAEAIVVEKITTGSGGGNSIQAVYGTDITDHTYVGYPATASDLDQRVEKTGAYTGDVFYFGFPMGDRTTYRYSQLFTTGVGDGFATQLLTDIQIYSVQTYTTKSCEIDVYAESGGLPTGASLGTLAGTYANGGGAGGYWSLTTGTPITLNSSTNYCFVLKILTVDNGPFDAKGYSYGTNAQVSTDSGATYSAASVGFNYKVLLYNPLDIDKVYEITPSAPTMVYVGYTTESKLQGQTGNVQISGLLSGFTGLTTGLQTVETINVGNAISTTEVLIVQPPL